MYLCRWPNGEFSIVNAATKDDAIVLLDEWGNAEQAALKRIPECMFDFRLRDDGEIELADIGEATYDFILGTCYPELEKALNPAESDENGSDFTSEGQNQIRDAVTREDAPMGQPVAREKSGDGARTRYSEADRRCERAGKSNCASSRDKTAAIQRSPRQEAELKQSIAMRGTRCAVSFKRGAVSI